MNEHAETSVTLDVEGISKELRIRPEIYLKIVSSFTATLGDKIAKLGEAVETNNIEQMRVILHEIKGTAGNLRLKTICDPEHVMHVAVKEDGAPQEKLREYFQALKIASEKVQKHVASLIQPKG